MKCYANFLAVFFTACIFLLGCSACGQPEEADIPEPIVVIEEPVDIEYEECSGFVGDHPCNFEFLELKCILCNMHAQFYNFSC